MHKSTFLPALVLCTICAVVAGQDKPEQKPAEKPKTAGDEVPTKLKREKKERPELEDAIKRAYKKAREVDDPKIARFQAVKGSDDDGGEALVCVVEFENGDVGFYLGSRAAAERDQWIVVEKAQLPVVLEAVRRQVPGELH